MTIKYYTAFIHYLVIIKERLRSLWISQKTSFTILIIIIRSEDHSWEQRFVSNVVGCAERFGKMMASNSTLFHKKKNTSCTYNNPINYMYLLPLASDKSPYCGCDRSFYLLLEAKQYSPPFKHSVYSQGFMFYVSLKAQLGVIIHIYI